MKEFGSLIFVIIAVVILGLFSIKFLDPGSSIFMGTILFIVCLFGFMYVYRDDRTSFGKKLGVPKRPILSESGTYVDVGDNGSYQQGQPVFNVLEKDGSSVTITYESVEALMKDAYKEKR